MMEFIGVENALHLHISLIAYPDMECHCCTLVAYLCPSSQCYSFFGDDNCCLCLVILLTFKVVLEMKVGAYDV